MTSVSHRKQPPTTVPQPAALQRHAQPHHHPKSVPSSPYNIPELVGGDVILVTPKSEAAVGIEAFGDLRPMDPPTNLSLRNRRVGPHAIGSQSLWMGHAGLSYVKGLMGSLYDDGGPIAPTRRRPSMPEYKEYMAWDAATRWFHWINALAVVGLICTGLIVLFDNALGLSASGKVTLKGVHALFGYCDGAQLAVALCVGLFRRPVRGDGARSYLPALVTRLPVSSSQNTTCGPSIRETRTRSGSPSSQSSFSTAACRPTDDKSRPPSPPSKNSDGHSNCSRSALTSRAVRVPCPASARDAFNNRAL